jgi:transcription elongation factor S-II
VLAKARGVEAAAWRNLGGTNASYKNKIRSLFVNLKDKANPGLRASVVDGTIAPERFAAMTSQVKSLLVLLHWLGLIIY